MLTVKRAREVFDYDPATGVFTNKVDRGCYKAGDVIAPGLRNGNVWGFTVDGRVVSAMRLVLLMQGVEMTPGDDFIYLDGDKTNLRASNVVRRPFHADLTVEVAREHFYLDGSTVRWKRDMAATARAGDRAGTSTKDGGMRVMLSRRFYNSAHVAYLLTYGPVPDRHAVRPIDGDWSNCNPRNLKLVLTGDRRPEDEL